MNENNDKFNTKSPPVPTTEILQPSADQSANQLDMFTPLLSQNKGDMFNIGKELLRSPKHLLQAAVLGRVKAEQVQLHTRMMFSHMNSTQGYVDTEQIFTYNLTLSIGVGGMARKEAVAATPSGYGYGIPSNDNLNPVQKLMQHEKKSTQ